MSITTTRIPLAVADQLVAWLAPILDPSGLGGLSAVGSVRRRKPDVGDLEFIAPMPAREDRLFARLDRVLRADGALFDNPEAIGERVKGVHEWFKMAAFTVKPPVEIWRDYVPVQVYRYEPENRGWIEAVRTGPAEFCRDVLVPTLKKAGYQARDGSIWSRHGEAAVRSERDLFHLLGMKWVEPEDRRGA